MVVVKHRPIIQLITVVTLIGRLFLSKSKNSEHRNHVPENALTPAERKDKGGKEKREWPRGTLLPKRIIQALKAWFITTLQQRMERGGD
jgi:hypothetical protein